MLVTAWLVITRVLYRAPPEVKVDREVVETELARLGPITFEERAVLAVFAATRLALGVSRGLEPRHLHATRLVAPVAWPGLVDDGTVAITMASLLFFVPGAQPGW